MTNTETIDKAAAVAEGGAPVAPEKTPSKKSASQKKGAPKAKKGRKAAVVKKDAKRGKKAASRPEPKSSPRAESKGAKILDLLCRPKGASLGEIMKATDWQAHSVQGFISTTGKKHNIESSKNEAGDRIYKLVK